MNNVVTRALTTALLCQWLSTITSGVITSGAIASDVSPVTAVAFAPGGDRVLVGSQTGIDIRSWPDLVLKDRLPTELLHVHDLAFSPDNRYVLLAGGAPAELGMVEVVHWPECTVMKRLISHHDLVMRVAWSPDGARFVTVGADGVCQCYNADASEPAVAFKGHSRGVMAACFFRDGQSVASAGLDQTIQLWDSRSGMHLRTLSNHTASVNDVALKPGDPTAAESAADRSDKQAALPLLASAGDDRTVRLWQPTIGRLVRFVKLTSIPRSIVWSLDGERLWAGCDDGSLRILDGETLQQVESVPILDGPVYAMALSPRGDALIVAGAGHQPQRYEVTKGE